MAEITINKEDMYYSDHIKSNVKSKSLLDHHSEKYQENREYISRVLDRIKLKVSRLDEIKERITSDTHLQTQLQDVDKERQSLFKQRNGYFQSKKFTTPDQLTLIEDSEIRQHLNKDENYNYVGSTSMFDLRCVSDDPRFAEAILRQSSVSFNSIELTEHQIETLKDLAYSGIKPEYESMLDDLDTIEEELQLNKQAIDNHFSTLLENLL